MTDELEPIETCPVCQKPCLTDDVVQYHFAGFENADNQLIQAPDYMEVHIACDNVLQQTLDGATDWTSAIEAAREIHNG
jgi:hypothetical protein